MKLILSRKGFDSGSGGVASPMLLPQRLLCSLPIPEEEPQRYVTRYQDITFGNGNLGPVVAGLTNGRIAPATFAHFDPDLNSGSCPRRPGWRGLFGQGASAEAHLRNVGVAAGDVFLFFGWFKEAEFVNGTYRFVRGAPDLHIIFGWLQIDSRIPECDIPDSGILPWAIAHPHCRGLVRRVASVYPATTRLVIGGNDTGFPGFGLFPCFDPLLRLTAAGRTRRYWRLPRWWHPGGQREPLSYHRNMQRWTLESDTVVLRSADRGQEFVLDCDDFPEAIPWLMELLDLVPTGVAPNQALHLAEPHFPRVAFASISCGTP
jgi:hypothetical protein